MDERSKQVYRRRYETAARQSLNCIKNKIKYGENGFQYGEWNSYTLQCSDLLRIYHRCNVARSWHWFRQVTAPCNVACGSGIMAVNSPGGSTVQCDTWLWDDMPLNSLKRPILESYIWFRFRPHYRSPTCHSATVSDILSKSDHPRQKKMTSCPFSRWWISAILDFRGPITGSLKSPYTTSYRSLIETIALTCLVFEKITVFCILATDRQTNEQTTDALSRSRCRKRRFNNAHVVTGKAINILLVIVKCW